MSNLYDSAFKDGVDFCIKVLQAYSEDSEEVSSFYDEAIQHIKETYSTMMGKMTNGG
jgi:hypothetical protein